MFGCLLVDIKRCHLLEVADFKSCLPELGLKVKSNQSIYITILTKFSLRRLNGIIQSGAYFDFIWSLKCKLSVVSASRELVMIS